MNNWQSIKLVPPVPSKVISSGLNALGHLFDTAPISDGQRTHWLTWSKDVRAMLTREGDAIPLTAPGHVLPMSDDEITLLLADTIGFGDDELQTCNRSDFVCVIRSVEAHRSSEIGLPPSTEWVSVADRLPDGEPGDPAIEFYNNDLRNPTRQVIGIYRDGVWLSGGHQFCNVTHWKPLTPAPVCEAGGEA